MKGRIIFFLLLLLNLCSHAQQTAVITIDTESNLVISKNIYGQFSEHLGRSIYDGIFKDGKIREDIVAALKKIQVPVLRWPGGCFADQYHWKDGIGPVKLRPKRINYNWGQVTEDNHFGTDEFIGLC